MQNVPKILGGSPETEEDMVEYNRMRQKMIEQNRTERYYLVKTLHVNVAVLHIFACFLPEFIMVQLFCSSPYYTWLSCGMLQYESFIPKRK